MGNRNEPGSFWDELNNRAFGSDSNQVELSRTALSGNIPSNPVDAHAQMLAARVEGLEKDVNSLQFVWPRVKEGECEMGRLEQRLAAVERVMRLLRPATQHATVDPLDAALALLKQCLSHLPMSCDLTGKVYEFLRNR